MKNVFVAHTFTIVERTRVLVMFFRHTLVDERFITEAVSMDALVKYAFVDC